MFIAQKFGIERFWGVRAANRRPLAKFLDITFPLRLLPSRRCSPPSAKG